ncbi:MAG: tRNA (adenosine(37)-N6)-threonylcarbamoyltransferase complex dimerization subunit type 1 TsaB [Methyloceanibacter sp.]|nr:tRNA (adenosine(37)-N6)-threonylcarbamoyltransferase complex dimerization subunit type 1 TsaB [Methyloceanibacter sp.]
MNILALDTSMGVCSAAVLRTAPSAQVEVLREVEMLRGHAEALIPMVEAVLVEAGLRPKDLDTIAATQGPGSFTGVRVAIAAARGLALTSDAVLFGTDSLTVMAHRALRDGLAPDGPFVIAVDARRGRLYVGLFGADGTRLDGPALLTPADAASTLPQDLSLALGSGAELLREAAAERGRVLTSSLPNLQPGALALAHLAAESDARTSALRPLYLRPPDAKPQNAALERRP